MKSSGNKEWLLAALAALPAFLLGLFVYRQGFNMLDDGLWLLGGRVLFEGGTLYQDLFSIYGPARYILLLPLFPLFGVSALSLAILKCLGDGLAAGLAFRASRKLGAGSWAWLVPLGIMALGPFQPRYVALLGLTLLLVYAQENQTSKNWFLAGLVWGFVALFGIDGTAYGTLLVVTFLTVGWLEKKEMPKDGLWLGLGFAGVVFSAIGLLMIRGAGDSAWWDAVVYPLTRFQAAMGISWWETFQRGPELGKPFAHLTTGEVLPGVWSSHGAGVTLGIRTLFVGLGLIPPLALVVAWRRGQLFRWIPWVVLALTGWLTMAGRGGGLHLKVAWLGTLVLVAGLLGDLFSTKIKNQRQRILSRSALVLGLVGLAAGWGTFLVEKTWLATHGNRPGLEIWDRPGARISLDKTRIQVIEEVFSARTPDGKKPLAAPSDPVLIWPAQPGLYAIMDRPLATAQATLLAGEVRDPSAVIRQLETSAPPMAVLGKTRGLVSGVRAMGELAPELWTWQRDHFWILQEFREGNNEFKVCAFEPQGRDKLLTIPLKFRLPDAEIRVLNKRLELPGPGVVIGQSFRVGSSDLAGLVVRFLLDTEGPAEVTLKLKLLGKSAPETDANDYQSFDRPLGQVVKKVTIEKSLKKIAFPFHPIPGSAGQDILMTLEVTETPPIPIGIGCHLFEGEEPENDLYPEGTAFVNGRSLAADLYLLTY